MSLHALLYRRPSEPRTIEIVFDKSVYPVRLRRHRQARRYTLRIQAATRDVILTIPLRGSLKEAREFANKHGGWIAARLGRLPEAAPFAHGVVLPLRGVPHRIMHRPGARGTVWTEAAPDGDQLLCVAGKAPHVDRRVGDYLRREAKRELETASLRYAQELGLVIRRVTVRDQSSRWGSCSTTGMLSFSWRLILAPHRARLSRRARSRAPRRNESFGEILAGGATPVPGSPTRQGVARRPWRGPASLRPARHKP